MIIACLLIGLLSVILLDHYEVSSDNVNWVNIGTLTTHTFSGLTNGTTYTFNARAVSVSAIAISDSNSIVVRKKYGVVVMPYDEWQTMDAINVSGHRVHQTLSGGSSHSMILGQSASVTSVPYGAPDSPVKVSQKPGDTNSIIVWSLTNSPYNGGEFDRFEASVNSGSYYEITPSLNDSEYTLSFNNLINLETNSIRIRVVTKNVSNANNVDTTKSSISLLISTTPFTVPAIPTGIIVSPSTNTVTLNWNAVLPAEIINNDVKYELYYKSQRSMDRSNDGFTIVSDITTNNYSVTGLTSNLMYDFKIRSTILNDESNLVYKSAFTELVQGRPFVYLNAPIMNLEAGNARIEVQLSPNVNNFFQTTFKYHATISDIDGNNAKSLSLTSVSDPQQKSILFTALGDSSVLVDLTQYKIVAYYEMLNTDNGQYYSSDTTTNEIKPFNATLAPVLSSVSHNQMISLTLNKSAFAGYTITNYEVSFDNVSWALINFNSTADSNVLTTNITLDQNGVDLVNGSTYYLYARVLYTINGEDYISPASNMVTNVPYTTSTAPTNVQSTPSNEQVSVSWSAPNSLGGLVLDHYEVKVNNGSWVSVEKNTSKIFTGLINGQSYTFYILAVTINDKNEEVYGASASTVNIPFTNSSAPEFIACDEMDGQLNFLWSEPSDLGGLELHHYEVKINNNDWIIVASQSLSTKIYIFTGLTNGQAYSVHVKAILFSQYSGYSDGSTLTRGPFYPYNQASQPGFVECIEGNTQLSFSWSEPQSLNGLPIDHYKIQIREFNSGSGSVIDLDPPINKGLSLNHTFTGLKNGKQYYLSIDAYTTHPNRGLIKGETLNSNNFVPFKKADVPIFTSIVQGDSNVFFTFDKPVDDPNAVSFPPLIRYVMQIFKSDNSLVYYTPDPNEPSVTEIYKLYTANDVFENTFYQLTNGESYKITIYAETDNGNSGITQGSIATSSAVIPYKAASEPGFVECIEGNTQLSFSWSEPQSLGGLPIDHYEVSHDNINWVNTNLSLNYTFTGLTNGQGYVLRVKAYTTHPNLSPIEGNTHVTNSEFIPYAYPGVPASVSCTQADRELLFTWSQPVSLGGLQVHHYEVSLDGVFIEINDTFYLFNELTNGQGYRMSIRAVTNHPNKGLISSALYTSNLFYPFKLASAPVFVECVEKDSELLLTWSQPVSLGGLPIDHYEVSIDDVNWVNKGLNLSHTFAGLTNGQEYVLRVKAYATHPNLSPIEGEVLVTDPFVPYKAPASKTITSVPRSGAVDFSWTAADEIINGLPFLDYQVSTDDINWSSINFTDYTLAGVNGGSLTLYVRVRVTHRSGPISSLSASNTNIPYAVANSLDHTSYTTIPSSQKIIFSWAALASQGDSTGLELDRYEVSKDQGVSWVSAGKNLTYTFNGLTNGQTYKMLARVVELHLYLGDVEGQWNATNYVSDVPYAQASAPANIVAVPGDTSVSLTWNAVTNFGGLPFLAYSISIDEENWQQSNTNSYTFNGLTNGTNYTFYISAFTSHPNSNIGTVIGDISSISNVVPYADPAKLVISKVIGDQQIQLSWNTPDLGGLTVDHYQLTYNGVQYNLNLNTNPNVAYTTTNTSSSVTIAGLTNGQTYNYSVAAVTSHPYLGLKTGPPSSVSGIPFVTPGLVSNIKSSVINEILKFSFTGPVDTNNNAILQYYEYSIDDVTFNALYQLLEYTTTVGSNIFTLRIRCYIMNPNEPLVRVTGPIEEVTNLQQVSVSSPQNLQGTVGDGTVTLTWDANPGVLFQVIRYFPNGSTFKNYTSNNFYTFSGLTNGISYNFGVNNYVNNTAGPVTNVSYTPASKPVIISVSKSGDILSLNIDFGGSSKINVDFGAFLVENNSINSTNVSTVVNYSPSVNPITFSGMSSYTYFNITVSNSIGSVSGSYDIQFSNTRA